MEILLGVLVVALLIERFLSERTHAAMTKRLLNMVAASNTAELTALNRVDDPPEVKTPEPRKVVHAPYGL